MFEERIKRGVSWLNEKFPGWLQFVHVETLDMNSYDYSLLGEIRWCARDPELHRKVYELKDREAVGFVLSDRESRWGNYKILSQEWKREIVQLREKAHIKENQKEEW